MTTLTEQLQQIPVDDIKAQTNQITFGRFLATVFTAVFVAAGWLTGATWYAMKYCFAAARYGYRQGARIKRTPATQSEELSKL
jgi:hypothetical protein